MIKKNTFKNIQLYNILLFLIIIIIISIIYYYFYYKYNNNNIDNDKICMSLSEYNKLKNNNIFISNYKDNTKNDDRDYRVLEDQLYPPLNRSDTITQTNLRNNIDNRNMYVSTNNSGDKYRLVGYLINQDIDKDAGGNNWKLFARQKDRHSSEFYMIPANNNYDVKIFIKDDIVVGERLRDIYSIPNNITFNSPMLSSSPYEFVEIPKADLSSSPEYI
tara:strand:+ start:493 stop:1146 length:654 start_codon:yes stop_codon:yes gene_type:complete